MMTISQEGLGDLVMNGLLIVMVGDCSFKLDDDYYSIVTDVLFCARFCHTWMYITYKLPIECTWILMIPMTGRSPNSSNSPLDSKFTSLKLQPQLRFILQHQTRILTPYIRRKKKKQTPPWSHHPFLLILILFIPPSTLLSLINASSLPLLL